MESAPYYYIPVSILNKFINKNYINSITEITKIYPYHDIISINKHGQITKNVEVVPLTNFIETIILYYNQDFEICNYTVKDTRYAFT